LYDARSEIHVSKGRALGQASGGRAVGDWAAWLRAIC